MSTRNLKRAPIDGVLLLDKPADWTSNHALMKVKHLLNARKAGHCGTLDPMATGLLPIVLGEATKFASDLLEADKTYEALVLAGVRTDSGDAHGVVLSQQAVDIGEQQWRDAISRFVGPIEQVPPMHSALKRDGRPLYSYARAGETVERSARPVLIHQIDILELQSDRAHIRVRCSKGTYIRTLAEDVGHVLGCGAHLASLRRVAIAKLSLADAVTIDAFEALTLEQRAARLAPLDQLLGSLPATSIDDTLAARFRNGQRIRLAAAADISTESAVAERVRVYRGNTVAANLLGLARYQDGLLVPLRLIGVAGMARPETP